MSDVKTFGIWSARTASPAPNAAVHPDDDLIDSITGAGRGELEALPVAAVYARLCAQLRDLGLEPAEAKVLRIANWISDSGVTESSPGCHAA